MVSDTLTNPRKERDAGAAPPRLQAQDWEVLLQYSKRSGKLRIQNRKFVIDPGTLHRLLANKMISPDGRLTRQAISKCEAMRYEMRTSLAGQAENGSEPVEPAGPVEESLGSDIPSPSIALSDADWAILMTYDRHTGHLLQYDSRTGRLSQGSLELLRDNGALQRLLKNKLIYPGGELTALAKRECERRIREQQIDPPAKIADQGMRPEKTPQPQLPSPPEENRISELKPVSEPKLLIPAETMVPPAKTDGSRKGSLGKRFNKYKAGEVDKNLISLLDPQCFESEQFKSEL